MVRSARLVGILLVVAAVGRVGAADRLVRLAGNGTAGFAGDGGPARDAEFGRWIDIAVNEAGDVFVADADNQRVRRIEAASGVVDTVAGTGERGFAGDEGWATKAVLGRLRGIAVDRWGSVYFADAENHRVRRITREGVMMTVAGTGEMGSGLLMKFPDAFPSIQVHIQKPTALACDMRGMVYVAGWFTARVLRVDPNRRLAWMIAGNGQPVSAGDDGPARDASIGAWATLAATPTGDVYVAERDHHRIRKITSVTGTIGTVVGNGVPGFGGDGGPARLGVVNGPTGVALDRDDALYIADRDNHRIRRVDPKTGVITTVAGNGDADCEAQGGPALATAICPEHVATDGKGNVYFTDGRRVPVVMRLEREPAP